MLMDVKSVNIHSYPLDTLIFMRYNSVTETKKGGAIP